MPDTVKVPGIGPVDQRWVIAAGAGVLGVAGFAWWRRGMAETGPAAEELPSDVEGVDDGTAWPSRPVGGSTIDPAAGSSAPTTNEEWTQQVIEALAALSYDPQEVATAIAKFFSRQGLTAREALIIATARAVKGHEPQGTYQIVLAPIVAPPRTPTAPAPAASWPKYVTGDGRKTLGRMVQEAYPAKGGTWVRKIAGEVAHRNGLAIADIDRAVARGRTIRIDKFS